MNHQERSACDYLITAKYVVPIRPHGVVLEDHALVIVDDVIAAIGLTSELQQRWQPKERIDRPQSVLMPGFVNAHTHNPMSLLRGLADDLPLQTWLREHIWPVETRVMGPEFVSDGLALAIVEMLRGGTTCANENYFFADVQAATYDRFGFRAVVGSVIIDFPTAWAKSDDEYFARFEELHEQWQDHPRIRIAIAPHAPYTVNDANLTKVHQLAQERRVKVHLHTHETAQEVDDSLSQFGVRPLDRLDRLGLVNSQLIAVHMTQVTPDEIALCAERGTSVVHCPESNLKLASGFCPAAAFAKAGVCLAIGTDGCASNNDLDMFGELRTAALLAKAVAKDPAVMKAADVLHAATLGGAQALGLDAKIGSLEVGKQADLICVSVAEPEAEPMHQVISHLVYAAGRQHVSDVWIAGCPKLRERQLVDIDLESILANARRWRDRIQALQLH